MWILTSSLELKNPNLFLEEPCDILIPAARERCIHRYNAPNLRCKIIAEASNGPVTVAGDEICREKKIMIIPDIILNTGGVTVGYFEWLKNIQHVEQGKLTKRWEEMSNKKLYEAIKEVKLTKEEFKQLMQDRKLSGAKEIDIVNSSLEYMLTSALDASWKKAMFNNSCMRMASLSSGLEKVAAMYKESGILF